MNKTPQQKANYYELQAVYFCDFALLEKENHKRIKDKGSDLQKMMDGELYCPEGSTLGNFKGMKTK